mgnify:CR=1 FL=1
MTVSFEEEFAFQKRGHNHVPTCNAMLMRMTLELSGLCALCGHPTFHDIIPVLELLRVSQRDLSVGSLQIESHFLIATSFVGHYMTL